MPRKLTLIGVMTSQAASIPIHTNVSLATTEVGGSTLMTQGQTESLPVLRGITLCLGLFRKLGLAV